MGIPWSTWDLIDPTRDEMKMMEGEDDLKRRGTKVSVRKWVEVTLSE
jgi:hypothetical protein